MRGRPGLGDQRHEQLAPHALHGPTDIAVVEGLPWPIGSRRVDPAAAGPQHMHDAADHPTVVDPRDAARLRRKVRLETSKLLIRQPKAI